MPSSFIFQRSSCDGLLLGAKIPYYPEPLLEMFSIDVTQSLPVRQASFFDRII